jgi:alpha-L-fucosidase
VFLQQLRKNILRCCARGLRGFATTCATSRSRGAARRRLPNSRGAPGWIEPMEPRRLLSVGPAPFVPPAAYAPATIEAENFDPGGEGAAFHNSVASSGGKYYRPDNIPVLPCTDAGAGYYVHLTQSGEWIDYTLNVTTTTSYTLSLRVRAPSGGGTFHIGIDHATHGTFHVPAAGWQNWTNISTSAVALTAGKHLVRIFIDNAPTGGKGALDLNWMQVRDNPLISPRTQWWRDAKYGMLVHLGLYSQLAGSYQAKTTAYYGELILWTLHIAVADYDKIASQFDPSNFNAADYVALAKAAGMKYIIFTAKHHEGFSMYNSAVSSFNITNTSFGRDPMRELADACHAAGLGFGIDYSIMDWQYPEQSPYGTADATSPSDPRIKAYVNGKLKPQLRELITNYNPDILWFDGEWKPWWNEESGRELEEFCRAVKPTLIINNRIGKGNSKDGDFDTPEQSLPTGGGIPGRPWEANMSLNDTYGYKAGDNTWKSPTTVIQTLMSAVSQGGNFLLNVGPDGTGKIPAASASILEQAGQWVNANADAIYGTTTAPITTTSWGDFTRKGNTLYAVVFNWPKTGTLHLNIAGSVKDARLLVGGQAVPFVSGPGGIDLTIPTTMPQQPATVIQIDFAGAMMKVKT